MTTEAHQDLPGVICRVPGTGVIEWRWHGGTRPARVRLVDELAMIAAFYVEEHAARIAALPTREARITALANIRVRKDGELLASRVEARVREIWAQRAAGEQKAAA